VILIIQIYKNRKKKYTIFNYHHFQNGVGWYIWIKKKIPDYRTIIGRLQDENRTKSERILVFEYIITNQCPTLF
jgi:hypothetical protein